LRLQFVDQSNDVEGGFGGSAAAKQYSRDHLATLVELNEQLASRGKYAINNHLGDAGDHVRAMMIEDFLDVLGKRHGGTADSVVAALALIEAGGIDAATSGPIRVPAPPASGVFTAAAVRSATTGVQLRASKLAVDQPTFCFLSRPSVSSPR
jgi:hypothetical protein